MRRGSDKQEGDKNDKEVDEDERLTWRLKRLECPKRKNVAS